MKNRLLLVLFLFLFFSCEQSQDPIWDGFDLQGHRGCRGLMPENSLESMWAALDLGVKTLELDVVITADKQVILSHEPYISTEICWDSTGVEIHPEEQYELNIYTMTAAEVQSFDCGSKGNKRFKNQQKVSVRKPLLQDVVESSDAYARQANRALPIYNIETKLSPMGDDRYHPGPEEFVQHVYDVIRSQGIEDRVTIQSFDSRSLVAMNGLDPNIKTVLLVEEPTDPANIIDQMGFVPFGLSPNHQMLDEALLSWAHGLGMKVVPWTINDEQIAEKLIELGVDGLITDYPDRIKAPE